MKKKALLSSILTIVLCISLIAGSTFALFTSESQVNIAVTSGKVKLTATIGRLSLYTPKAITSSGVITDDENIASGNNFGEGGYAELVDNKLKLFHMIPGDKATAVITLNNESNVNIQYRVIVKSVGEDNALLEALNITIGEGESAISFTGDTVKFAWMPLEINNDESLNVTVELPGDTGDEYQEKECELAFTVEAVQGNADMPDEWDGVTTTAVSANTEDGKYHINTAAELMWLMNESQSGGASRFTNEQFVLESNIDLGGATITGFGNEGCIFGGSFDGKNHSISNFVIKRSNIEDFAGLFNYYCYGTLENLTVKNASVNGICKVGALVGGVYDNATVKNCSVVDCVVVANRKAAGAIGYGQNATVENISVKNTTIYVESTDAAQYGKVVGYVNTGLNITDPSDENVTILTGRTYVADGVMRQDNTYFISNANGLVYCATTFTSSADTRNKVFKLTADIDMTGIDWTPWCNEAQYFDGTFDGQNHTISNLTVNDGHTDFDGHAVGFIGRLGTNGAGANTIQNVTFDNANVSGHHYVGVAVGYNEYGTMSNVKVTNSKVTATHVAGADSCGDKAGAVVGFVGADASADSVKNCSATSCEVKAARDAGQIVGAAKAAQVSGCVAENVNVTEVVNSTCDDSGAGYNINNAVIGRVLG